MNDEDMHGAESSWLKWWGILLMQQFLLGIKDSAPSPEK